MCRGATSSSFFLPLSPSFSLSGYTKPDNYSFTWKIEIFFISQKSLCSLFWFPFHLYSQNLSFLFWRKKPKEEEEAEKREKSECLAVDTVDEREKKEKKKKVAVGCKYGRIACFSSFLLSFSVDFLKERDFVTRRTG